MPDSLFISKLKMPNNNEYLIKDAALTARVDALELAGFETKIYTTLPSPVTKDMMHILALVADASAPGDYLEYVVVNKGTDAAPNYAWEQIGTTSTDLADYLKASEVTTATGTVTVTSENHSHTYKEATGVSNEAETVNLTNGSASYTPEGTIEITGTSTVEFNTETSTTGISATPTNTETALSLTDNGHTHGLGTLSGTVGTGITLSANAASATGRITYLEGATFGANTPTDVTLPTYTAGSCTMPTRASHAVMADTYTYDSTTETLTFASEDVWEITDVGSYTAPTWNAGSVTPGTAATFTPSTKYLGAALSSGAVSFGGSLASATTGITGTYLKATGISITDTGHNHKYSGDIASALTATFTGSASTIAVSGSVTYSKATSLTFNNAATTGSAAAAKASTYNVAGGSVVTINHAAS